MKPDGISQDGKILNSLHQQVLLFHDLSIFFQVSLMAVSAGYEIIKLYKTVVIQMSGCCGANHTERWDLIMRAMTNFCDRLETDFIKIKSPVLIIVIDTFTPIIKYCMNSNWP